MHLKTTHWWPAPVFCYRLSFSLLFHLFIYLFWTNKLSLDYLIFLYRSFWLSNGTGRVLLDWWKFERSIRSHGAFNIFALFKQNWGTRLNFNFCLWFGHLPCAKCWFSKFKMASPSWVSTHQCTHAFTVQQFRRLSSHLASHAGLFSGARIWPLLKNACSTENNISHSFIRVVSDQSTVLSLTFVKGHKAFLVFHADQVHCRQG